ncbi:MAG: hypothetical protein ACXVH3_38835 [Solirubrobacteraceae bacterium]
MPYRPFRVRPGSAGDTFTVVGGASDPPLLMAAVQRTHARIARTQARPKAL